MKFACHCECSHVGVHWPVHNVVCAQWSGGTRLSTFFSSLSSNAKLFTFRFRLCVRSGWSLSLSH